MHLVSVNKHSGQFLVTSARSRKISSNWSTHSEALARKRNQTLNVRENNISQGFKTKLWGKLENSRCHELDFSFDYKFSHS